MRNPRVTSLSYGEGVTDWQVEFPGGDTFTTDDWDVAMEAAWGWIVWRRHREPKKIGVNCFPTGVIYPDPSAWWNRIGGKPANS